MLILGFSISGGSAASFSTIDGRADTGEDRDETGLVGSSMGGGLRPVGVTGLRLVGVSLLRQMSGSMSASVGLIRSGRLTPDTDTSEEGVELVTRVR